MTLFISGLDCPKCKSTTSEESCCSLDEGGRCAGKCDEDGHTFASVNEHIAQLEANHQIHIEDGENISDCPRC